MKVVLIASLAAIVVIAAVVILRPGSARAEVLKEGALAPAITTQMVSGDQITPFSLADYRGKKVILYFYPKDDTPGCTKEACSFRDGYSKFQNAGLTVLGCSIDSEDAHKKFIKKYNIPFPLLLDPDKKIATAYGVANGIPILGLDKRVTYVIDENGRILKVYPKVDPAIHATEILSALPPPPPAAATAASPATSEAPK